MTREASATAAKNATRDPPRTGGKEAVRAAYRLSYLPIIVFDVDATTTNIAPARGDGHIDPRSLIAEVLASRRARAARPCWSRRVVGRVVGAGCGHSAPRRCDRVATPALTITALKSRTVWRPLALPSRTAPQWSNLMRAELRTWSRQPHPADTKMPRAKKLSRPAARSSRLRWRSIWQGSCPDHVGEA